MANIKNSTKNDATKLAALNRFRITDISRHVHGGVNSPITSQPTFTYTGLIGVGVFSATDFVTVTGSFSGGEVSATLTSAWPNQGGVFSTSFSNGDVKSVTYSNGSTAITWTGGLSGAATANLTVSNVFQITPNLIPKGWTISYGGTGEYTITHNLNTLFYTCIASAAQSSNAFAIPIIETFANEVTFTWGGGMLGDTEFSRQDTGFFFQLTTIANKNITFPTYTTNNL